MKITIVFVIALSVSTTWAIKTKSEEPKDKRETLGGYPSSGHSSHSYQAPSLGHEGASAISVGAGYSIGGAKPSFTYGEPVSQHGSGAAYQISSEGLPASGHATLQLAPITLQASQGHGGLVSNDLSQLMSQLSHGLNSGAISLPSGQEAIYQFGGQAAHGQGGQELSFPQFTYGAPKLQQYTLAEQSHVSVPAYAAGTKGLGSYSSTGPVLFTPSETQGSAPLSYGGQSSGQSYIQPTLPLGDSGLAGLSLGGSGHSFGGSLKHIGGSYLPPSKASFKPSTFLGSSVQSEGHGLSGISGSYGAPSFSSYQPSSGSHGLSLGSSQGYSGSFGGSLAGFGSGSSKFIAPSYLPPKSSEGSFGSLESLAAFSSGGHLPSPPGTTYGVPTGSYSAGNAHTASSSPQYYVTKHSSPSSFGHGSSSFKGPISSHGSLNSFSSGPKYSFGGHSSSRYGPPKDASGAYSENSYNTIKYSEELKPHHH
ncbi:uncharacterized protein [Epargyreus clarus]|uniref:uncharacterized protein n=1 Tax=Epargyreus clarus TaxID=520877 RepID=UPI003C2F4438